jgi:hypothetical protein
VYGDNLQASGDNELIFDGVIDTPEMSLEEGVRVELKPSVQDSLSYKIPKQVFRVTCNNRFTDEYCANSYGPKTSAELLQERTGMTIDEVIDQTHFKDAALLVEVSGDYSPCVMIMTSSSASNIDQKRPGQVSGDLITLEHPFPATVSIGDEYSLQRDCAKEYKRDCKNRFGNHDNFRGFKSLPKTIVAR